MRTVLFVCTGNTCRSPMAEAIALAALDKGLLGPETEVFVASAGIQAGEGSPTSPQTLQTLADMGIEHTGRSKRLTGPMVRKADLVLCMTPGQQIAARELVADTPEHAEKVLTLDPDGELEDPMGLGQDAYDSLGKQLQKLIPRRLRELLSDNINVSR